MARKIRLIASARALAPLALSVLLTLATTAHGGITFYRGGKTIGYSQTSNSQPTTPTVFYGGFDLFASNPLDLTSARVFSTSPTNPSPASPFVLTQYAPGGWISQQAYPSLAAMDLVITTANTYGFLVEGGLLGSRLALLPAPATNLFSPEVPYFTANAFTSLNGMNPAAPFPLSWNGYTPLPGINNSPIFMSISRVSDGQSMIGTTVDNTTTSFLIPPNTLAPNTQYNASLGYSSRIVGIDAGFIDADSTYNFDRGTNLLFTTGSSGGAAGSTIPEPHGMRLPLVGLLMLLAALRLRRPRLAAPFCTLLVLATLASSAQAAVDFYRVGKTIAYSQTSDSPPTTAISFSGGVDMATPAPPDFTSARVFSTKTMPPSPVPEFTLTQFSSGYWGSSQFYPSLAEMNANLPPGDTFGYLIEGGTLGPQLALLPLPTTNLFSPTVPYYAGSTYSQLNGLDTTTPYTINWNGYTPVADVTDSPIFLAIYRVSDGQNITGTVASNTTTAFQIPANTLAPDTHYKASLDYSSRQNAVDAGFFTADSSALFDVVTELEFTTAPFLAGDYNRNHKVDAADYTAWRNTLGQMGVPAHSGADGNGDGNITATDYGVWKTNYGMTSPGLGSFSAVVPEPATTTLAFLTLLRVFISRPIRRARSAGHQR